MMYNHLYLGNITSKTERLNVQFDSFVNETFEEFQNQYLYIYLQYLNKKNSESLTETAKYVIQYRVNSSIL